MESHKKRSKKSKKPIKEKIPVSETVSIPTVTPKLLLNESQIPIIADPTDTKSEVENSLSDLDINKDISEESSEEQSKCSKRFKFLKNLNRRSFRKKSASSLMPDDMKHLGVPRMRSSSVGYLSEVFYDVHNLFVAPAQFTDDEIMSNLHSHCNLRAVQSTSSIYDDCITCPHKVLSVYNKQNPRFNPLKRNRVKPIQNPAIAEILKDESKAYNQKVSVPKGAGNQSVASDINNKPKYEKSTRFNKKRKKSFVKISHSTNDLMSTSSRPNSWCSDNISSAECSIGSLSSDELAELNAPFNTGRSVSCEQLPQITQSPLSNISPAIAKHRNYLFGGLGSLLGASELQRYFPDRTVTVFIATWNMNAQSSPASLDDFLLPDEMERMPDMYVIGTQESDSDMTEFEVKLQTSIGPSHVLFSSAVYGILHLCVFLRRDLVWFCSVPEQDSHSLRPGTYFKTKGAVAISFQFFGTRLLFINSHLFAHEEKLEQRIDNYKTIIRNINLPRNLRGRKLYKHKDVTYKYDYIFWMGDLNFRLEGHRESIIDQISSYTNPEQFTNLMKFDQLNNAREKGQVFIGFDEATVKFAPTFKYDVGTHIFDTSNKQRVPSYTDRILYKSSREPVICEKYDSCPIYKTSDHKPVWGLYRFKIRPGKDDVPLAAGLFQRDVYLQALKRRRRLFHQQSSKNCQVQ